VKVLAEIPARTSPELRTGSLRRSDLDAYGGLLEKLDGARIVLVTGANPGWGSVAAGLASTAAAGGSRTALLECNLAEPGLADALGLANAPGLHEYLSGAAEVEAILQPLALAGPGSAAATEPLVCIVAGRPAGTPWALLSSDRFRDAIDGLRATYELVIVDGPPIADRYALRGAQGAVDSTLLCVGPGESKRKLPIPASGLVIQN
jgi:Mrp family chromosome partitioning ATPase